MDLTLGWLEIALRLVLAAVAGGIIGLNRGEKSQPAGMRTTVLVCLAAAISMIQANLLLGLAGKTPASFAVMDLMRLPLGILSGMGFIGAGAILRRDNLVLGVTTAATLWFATVMGLCFGGGQIGLGLAAFAFAVGVLWGLKHVEKHVDRHQHGTLTLCAGPGGPDEEQLARLIAGHGGRVTGWIRMASEEGGRRREIGAEVEWRFCPSHSRPPPFLQPLTTLPGVLRVEWKL